MLKTIQGIKLSLLLIVGLLLSGCARNTYNHPTNSEPHAILIPIKDEKHVFSIFQDSTIFINYINGQLTDDTWKGINIY